LFGKSDINGHILRTKAPKIAGYSSKDGESMGDQGNNSGLIRVDKLKLESFEQIM
jgi:hypothetical protein